MTDNPQKESPSNSPVAWPPIVAGCWRMAEWKLTPQQRLRWIEQCLDFGVNRFDHADIYGDYQVETLFGEAIALAPPSLRTKLQLITKCGIKLPSSARPDHRAKYYDTSSEHIRRSVEQSLRNLRIDHLDLLLIHRPDALMDPAQIAECFAALQREGKVLHFGCSNHSPSQFALLNGCVRLETNQVEFSPLHLQPLSDGTLDQAVALQRPPMIWSPLAGGRLFRGVDERSQRVRTALEEVGAAHGLSVSGTAYAWIMRHPSRPQVVTGTQRVDEIKVAVTASRQNLSREEWYRVWEASNGSPVP